MQIFYIDDFSQISSMLVLLHAKSVASLDWIGSVMFSVQSWIYCFFFYFPLQKRREEMERLEKEKQAELRSYRGLMVAEKMTSNKDIASSNKSLQELEDDFMWW